MTLADCFPKQAPPKIKCGTWVKFHHTYAVFAQVDAEKFALIGIDSDDANRHGDIVTCPKGRGYKEFTREEVEAMTGGDLASYTIINPPKISE